MIRYLLGMESINLCPYPVIGGEYKLNIPGETQLPGWAIKAEIIPAKPEGVKGSSETTIPLSFGKGKGTKGLGFKNSVFTAFPLIFQQIVLNFQK